MSKVRKRRKNRTTKSAAQLKIEIMLMKAGISKTDIADHYGHTPQNTSAMLLRENVDYFRNAIDQIKKADLSPTG